MAHRVFCRGYLIGRVCISFAFKNGMFESYNTILDKEKPVLSKEEFKSIFERQFLDSRFSVMRDEISRLSDIGYQIYLDERKSKAW